jgi:hypothetical protein
MTEMKCVQYKRDFKDEIIKLLSYQRNPKYISFKNIIWDWQYNKNPSVSSLPKSIALFEKKKLVGFTGLMPTRFKYYDNTIYGYWSVDAFVDISRRGFGYGSFMVDKVKNMQPLIMAYGISDVQAHIRKKMGFKTNSDIDEFLFVSKSNRIKDFIKKAFQLLISFTNSRNVLCYNSKISNNFDIQIVDATHTPKQIDNLWSNIKEGYKKIVIRDYSYIKWKYGNFPLTNYKMIVVNIGNELAALGIFRRSPSCSKLVDYVGPAENFGIKYAILRTFKKQCSGSRLLSCICTDGEFKKILRTLGFRRYRTKPRFYVFSNLENDLEPEKDWFIMHGDSDGDFSEFDFDSRL